MQPPAERRKRVRLSPAAYGDMMAIKLYNSLTRKKELLKPLNGNEIKMFVCGPTVYDYSHLGHARTYIAYDIIARYFRYRGFKLLFLMNITDVDDKIIKRAKETKKHPLEVAKHFENLFFEDMKTLGIDSINIFARASEYIPEIIDQVQRLSRKGFAYETETGIYYDITKFDDYGKLSHQNPEQLKKHRIEPDPTKLHPQDFSLWKFQKSSELSWDSPWGKGRPGWHIEDTAISEKYLGQQYDIHGGGIDLIFPHHEAEIAQMESVSRKKPMVKYWIHTGFLMVNREKMAKSLKNFVTIRGAIKEYDAEVLRYFFSSVHYRSPIDYSVKNLKQAKNSLDTLYTASENVQQLKQSKGRLTSAENKLKEKIKTAKKSFIKEMDDDFNTPHALAVLFDLAKEVNVFVSRNKAINTKLLKEVVSTFKELGSVFNILQRKATKRKLPKEIKKLIEEREKARKKRDWKKSDAIRIKLKKMGVVLEDTPEGPRWKFEK